MVSRYDRGDIRCSICHIWISKDEIEKETRLRKNDNILIHTECGKPIRRVRRCKTSWAMRRGWHGQKVPIKFTKHQVKNDILLNKEKWKNIL